YIVYIFCFFFQAEDGIRDRNVTGVQTCALPILDSDKLIRYILIFHEEVNPYAIGVRGMVEIYSLIMVGILILMTAFFVAAEFAIVRMRKSRVDYLVEQGTKGANAVKKVTETWMNI